MSVMTKSLEGLLDHAQGYATRAEAFIAKNGVSVTDENKQMLIKITSLYLAHIDHLCVVTERKNCYVVHSQDSDHRFQTSSYKVAFSEFKEKGRTERVGLFHWDYRQTCRRIHASDNYTLTRDY